MNKDDLKVLLCAIKASPSNMTTEDKDGAPESEQKEQLKEKAKSPQYRLKEEEIFDRKQDRNQRRIYADNIFCFLCIYMFFVFLIIVASAKNNVAFHLSDSVLIALITTTTANVIGIFVIVVKYLFNLKSK